MTRKLLVVAYYFPPDGGPGTQRAAKFCKYLPGYGWDPVVLTRTPPESRGRWDPEDRTLLEEIGAATRVEHVPEPFDPVSRRSPGQSVPTVAGWAESLSPRARSLIHDGGIEAVLVTMSPFELVRFGSRLKEDCDIPLIYDLRDPWALDGWRLYPGKRAWKRDFAAMSEALLRADGVIANTPEAQRVILDAIPRLDPEALFTIPNGFDRDDFTAVPQLTEDLDSACFWLVHTGSFHSVNLYRYEGWKGPLRRLRHFRPERIDPSGRTPRHLLEAVRLLERKGHPLGRSLRLACVGLPDRYTRRCVTDSGLADRVRFVGYRSHAESIAWLLRADALFLPLHGSPDGLRSRIVPAKVYEYLASGRPILACLPPGDARDLVQRSDRAVLADPCEAESIAGALERLHAASGVEGEIANASLDEVLLPYTREALAGKLAACLDTVCGVSGGAASGAS